MRLPGLPHTKSSLITRAKRQGWHYEEAQGIGGTKRFFDIPSSYLEGTSYAEPVAAKVIGNIAAGSTKVDPALLEIVIRALGEWESERGVQIAQERRPAVIAILYDYLQKAEADKGAEAMAGVLRALGKY